MPGRVASSSTGLDSESRESPGGIAPPVLYTNCHTVPKGVYSARLGDQHGDTLSTAALFIGTL